MESTQQTPQLPPAKADGYTWSGARILEQVAINVLSWLSIAVVAAGLAGLGLLAQWAFHYVVIPTHVLVVILFIGIGILLTLLLVAGMGYWCYRKYPWIFFGAAIGVIVSVAIKSGALKDALKRSAASPQPEPPTA